MVFTYYLSMHHRKIFNKNSFQTTSFPSKGFLFIYQLKPQYIQKRQNLQSIDSKRNN